MQGKAQTVGNGMRTIAINIANMAEETDTWTAANGKVNVALKDSEGNIRSTYEIMKDLHTGIEGTSVAWNDLTEAEQNEIAVAAAGKTRYDVFTSSMGNFESAIYATETAMNSTGSAMKENEAALDSVEGHLSRLKSAFENFAYKTFSSDFIKGVMDAGTAVLNFLSSDIGQAATKWTAIGGAILVAFKSIQKLQSLVSDKGWIGSLKYLWSGNQGGTIAKNATGINRETEAVNRNTRAWQQNAAARRGATSTITKGTAVTKGSTVGLNQEGQAKKLKSGVVYSGTAKKLGTITKEATKGTKALTGLKSAASGLAGALGLTPWTAVIGGIVGLGALVKSQVKTFDELKVEAEDSAAEVENLKQQIDALENTRNRTPDQDSELRSLKGQLAVEEQITKQRQQQAADKYESESIRYERASGKNDSESWSYNEPMIETSKQVQEIDKYKSQIAEAMALEKEWQEAEGSGKERALEKYNKQMEDVADTYNNLSDYYSEMSELNKQGMLPESLQDDYQQLKQFMEAYGEATNQGTTGAFEISQALSSINFDNLSASRDEVQNLGTALIDGFEGTDEQIDKLKTLQTALGDTGVEGAEAFGELASSIEGLEFDKKNRMLIDPTQIEDLAKEMGLTEDAARELFNTMNQRGLVNWDFDGDSIRKEITQVGNAFKRTDGTVVSSTKDFNEWAKSQGLNKEQTKEARKAYIDAGNALVNVNAEGKTLSKQLANLGEDFVQVGKDGKTVESVNFNNIKDLLTSMNFSDSDIYDYLQAIEELGGVKIEGKGYEDWKKNQKEIISGEKDIQDARDATAKSAQKSSKKQQKADEDTADTAKKSSDNIGDYMSDRFKSTKNLASKIGKGVKGFFKDIFGGGKEKAKAEVEVEGAEASEKKVKELEKTIEGVDGAKGTGEVLAEDKATAIVSDAEGKIYSYDKASGTATLLANDLASLIAMVATGNILAFNGTTATGTLDMQDGNATSMINLVTGLAEQYGGLNPTPSLSATDNASGTINSVSSKLSSLNGKTARTYVITEYQTKGQKARAKGKRKGEEGGLSWVGDEGNKNNPKPELIQTKNGAYLAGTKGWELVHLDRDDIVYTAAETRRLLSKYQLDGVGGLIPRYAKGKKSKKQKRIEKLQDQFDKNLSRLEDRRDMYNWSDTVYRKKYNALYKKYQKKIKKINKKKGLGSDRKWDKKVAIRETKNDAAVTSIETAIEGLEAYTGGYGASGLDSSRKTAMAQIDAALKKVQQARKANKISAEEAKEYQQEIQEARMEVYRKDAELQVQSLKREKTTYAKSVSYVKTMYQQKKLSAEDYYTYLQELSDQAYENEINKLEEQQEKTEAQLDLMDEYVSKQIDALEKQKEALETQNEEQETTNELMEAEAELARAKAQRVKVYREGKGFGYEYDAEEIKEAQQAVQEAQTNKEIEELEKLIEQWEAISERLDEVETDAGIKDLENTVGSTAEQLFASLGMDPEKWAEMAKNLHSQSMGIEDLIEYLEEQQELGYTIEQALNNSSGTVSQSLLNSYIGKNKFASGTLSAMGGLSLVGENGAELRVLNRGDAIIPSKITSNLMQWGSISPSKLVDEIKVKETPVSQEYKYSFDKLVLPNVKNADEFVSALKQLPNQAIQMSNKRK